MRAPSIAIIVAVASLCNEAGLVEAQQDPLKEQKSKDRYKAACPVCEL